MHTRGAQRWRPFTRTLPGRRPGTGTHHLQQPPSDAISVVLCTYNGEHFITEQLNSLFDQTQLPAEIIVSDDGSTDGTLDLVATMASTSPTPIRVHRNETRLGYAENFLQACSQARSPYIAFSDQDDRWEPHKLRAQLTELKHHQAQLCVHAVHAMDSDGARLPRTSRRTVKRARIVKPLSSPPWGNYLGFTMLFDRALLGQIPIALRGEDPHTHHAPLSHDRWVYFLASTFGRTVVLNEELASYRQHDSQLYGGVQSRSVRERVATKLASGQSQAHYLADLAHQRAELLERLTPAGEAAAWIEGVERWRLIEAHTRRSARLYASETLAKRTRVLWENLLQGVYRASRFGGLGHRRLIEDMLVAAARIL